MQQGDVCIVGLKSRILRPTAMLSFLITRSESRKEAYFSNLQSGRNRPSTERPDGYLLGSYRIATAPEPSSSRLTSFRSTSFDSPANNVGPWPTKRGCTTNSYSSIN